jgi:hypothetical protein
MKKLYIITNNHNVKATIKEFSSYFKKNFELKLSKKIKKNNINLILEEFTEVVDCFPLKRTGSFVVSKTSSRKSPVWYCFLINLI